jgi:hypothetical protein
MRRYRQKCGGSSDDFWSLISDHVESMITPFLHWNIGNLASRVKRGIDLKFPESVVDTVVPERHSRERWGNFPHFLAECSFGSLATQSWLRFGSGKVWSP